MSKMWYIHTAEYCSALKIKGILKYATAWMNFEEIILSAVCQSQYRLTDSTFISYPNQGNSKKLKVEWQLPGDKENSNERLLSDEQSSSFSRGKQIYSCIEQW